MNLFYKFAGKSISMKRLVLILLMLSAIFVQAQEDNERRVLQDSRDNAEVYRIENIHKIGFLTLNASYDNYGKTAFGLTYGVVKRYGWYASVMTNFNFKGFQTDYNCDADFFVGPDYPMYTGKDNYTSFSAMGGFMYSLNRLLYLRAGVGFGAKILSYELNNKKQVKNATESAMGVDLSVGAVFRFKKIMLSLDCVTTNGKYYEARLGLGINYKR